MPQPKGDLSKSLSCLRSRHRTLIAVVELSQSSWLVGGIVPGIERDPLKKLVPTRRPCSICSIAGVTKPSRPVIPSRALLSPSRPAATAFGWRDGCGTWYRSLRHSSHEHRSLT